ncbi:MAG: alpha-hydroxy-acid oxidizing protein [Flavobacteriaceae bacterium]|nr:alpha-hydroxy-acid oxidizing protein [Flavobacteriaceae bacterium]
MNLYYNPNYPTISDLRRRAKKKIPKFAFEYLDGGCNDDINLLKNNADIHQVELQPEYLNKHTQSTMKTDLFGVQYDAPFGIAPVGLQGLMWPNSAEILAKAALEANIPFILSTVTTSSIERIAEITNGKAWFQLYHPAEERVTDDILKRAADAGYEVLVILADVPTFGYRPRDIRNGLAMPPRMTLSNIIQVFGKPNWALQTLKHGQPSFKTLEPYMPKNLDLKQLGLLMDKTFSGRLNEEKVKRLRDKWKGKIVIKGVVNPTDVKKSIDLGLDGIIVSNHGGRQLDAGESSIHALQKIIKEYQGKTKIMIDGGIRSGPDIASMLASGAEFTFMGRPFMYGVAALGSQGGTHTINILKIQLEQIMNQLCCKRVEDFPNHLIK